MTSAWPSLDGIREALMLLRYNALADKMRISLCRIEGADSVDAIISSAESARYYR